jgi:hypothetical protein
VIWYFIMCYKRCSNIFHKYSIVAETKCKTKKLAVMYLCVRRIDFDSFHNCSIGIILDVYPHINWTINISYIFVSIEHLCAINEHWLAYLSWYYEINVTRKRKSEWWFWILYLVIANFRSRIIYILCDKKLVLASR